MARARERDAVRKELLPTVAVVGRPNVGKSTLVNRFAGRREAIVQERPGVTRDRTTHVAEWRGRSIAVVDTGGWVAGWDPTRTALDEAVAGQADAAARLADLVLLVVDAGVGATEEDVAVASRLRSARVPVVLVANQSDRVPAAELPAALAELYALGLGDPHPVSALHGRGSGDLLDAVVDGLEAAGAFDRAPAPEEDALRVALLGRPNVGKSSLLNRVVGEERAIVDDRPGTTRDAVDTLVEVPADEPGAPPRTYRFVDTAGLRRKSAKLETTEYYSTVRTRRALDEADVALLVVDAVDGIGEQEQKLAREIVDAGRALVLVLNKWDLVDEDRREQVLVERERLLHFVGWAPLWRTSAVTGRGVRKLLDHVDSVAAQWSTRVPTAALNTWLADAVAAAAPPLHQHRPVRLRYATQVAASPPTFRVFTNAPLEDAYLRYLERRLRERFGFEGSPVRIAAKVRPGWEEHAGERGARR